MTHAVCAIWTACSHRAQTTGDRPVEADSSRRPARSFDQFRSGWVCELRQVPRHAAKWHTRPLPIGQLTPTRDSASQRRAQPSCQALGMTYLPTLYKCRGVPVKSPICAICLDRTRGTTRVRELTHGVKVSLCDGHHSVEFLRRRAGRDFAVTLMRIWRAHGCFTRARSRALDAHLRAIRALGTSNVRARPGSYAWPACGAKQKTASPAANTSSPRSPGCANNTPAITPKCPASAPCAVGLRNAAGSDPRWKRGPGRQPDLWPPLRPPRRSCGCGAGGCRRSGCARARAARPLRA